MTLIPNRFLFRVAYSCRHVRGVPSEGEGALVELPEEYQLEGFHQMDGVKPFADVRLGWNELGLALQVEVRGKQESPGGDLSRPSQSDGITLWLDTRDSRTSHRASRYCHQFHFLPAAAGPERGEPAFLQTKIHRALHDAPLANPGDVPFRAIPLPGGYRLEAFLPVSVLNGFDPEQNPRLGVHYLVRDRERGEQALSAGSDFPHGEDPSLWSVLELVRG
jgi:hypothetical protein